MAIGKVTQTGVWALLWTDILGSGHPWGQIEFSQLCGHKL